MNQLLWISWDLEKVRLGSMETTLDVTGQLFFQAKMVVPPNVITEGLTMMKSVRPIVENLLRDGTFSQFHFISKSPLFN